MQCPVRVVLFNNVINDILDLQEECFKANNWSLLFCSQFGIIICYPGLKNKKQSIGIITLHFLPISSPPNPFPISSLPNPSPYQAHPILLHIKPILHIKPTQSYSISSPPNPTPYHAHPILLHIKPTQSFLMPPHLPQHICVTHLL